LAQRLDRHRHPTIEPPQNFVLFGIQDNQFGATMIDDRHRLAPGQ
jgi:hypothetical protein